MNVAIVYDSKTGTTRSAARSMGKELEAQGHSCQVQSIWDAEPDAVSKAELICVGSWVQGYFIIGQHPTKASLQFINGLGDLAGRRAIVFCTYKIAAGPTLRRMEQALQAQGADVIARFKFRGPQPGDDFASFAASLA